ncbi:hypothetical protein CXB51_014936 [Gossypium anomalum]|uniref:Uncharacterized protein n=1 Tax=Gossypium anomalum TaxID=47600 RepID=A0A8J6D589_9ROSI|nr:hypothetical protein CXB51_014936 [Gossypium anomalum]
MRPSRLAVSLLVLFIIYLSSVQGIRLDKSFKPAGHDPIQEGALMKSSNGVMGDILLCKQGHCTGKGRKLFTATNAITPTSSTISEREDKGENKVIPISTLKPAVEGENGGKPEKFLVGSPTTSQHPDVYHHYVNIMDIVEMDYSPARRKPPIHN